MSEFAQEQVWAVAWAISRETCIEPEACIRAALAALRADAAWKAKQAEDGLAIPGWDIT